VPYELGVPPAFAVEDLLDGARYTWRLGGNYVRLDPGERAGHVLRVRTP
jgi:starch synthase (maltosyl-transferring)